MKGFAKKLWFAVLVGAMFVAAICRLPVLVANAWPVGIPWTPGDGLIRGLQTLGLLGQTILATTAVLCLVGTLVVAVGQQMRPPADKRVGTIACGTHGIPLLHTAVTLQFVVSAGFLAVGDPVWGSPVFLQNVIFGSGDSSWAWTPSYIGIDAALAALVLSGVACLAILPLLLEIRRGEAQDSAAPQSTQGHGVWMSRTVAESLAGLVTIVGVTWVVSRGAAGADKASFFPPPKAQDLGGYWLSLPIAAQALLVLLFALAAWITGWALHSAGTILRARGQLGNGSQSPEWRVIGRATLALMALAWAQFLILTPEVRGRLVFVDYRLPSHGIQTWYVSLDAWAVVLAVGLVVGGMVSTLSGLVWFLEWVVGRRHPRGTSGS